MPLSWVSYLPGNSYRRDEILYGTTDIPYLVYDATIQRFFTKRIKTGLIYTMGCERRPDELMGYDSLFNIVEMVMKRIFGESESLFVTRPPTNFMII